MSPDSLDRSQLLRRLGLAAAGVALPSALTEQASAASFLKQHPRWRFVFVNHATTNPFFVPTRFGIQDACALYGVTSEWTGSRRSDVGEMIAATTDDLPELG